MLVGGHLVQAVRFADDQAMIASSVNGLQNIMTKLNNRVKDLKMEINEKKTKVMKIGRGEAEEVKITINGNELEQVHQFKYLWHFHPQLHKRSLAVMRNEGALYSWLNYDLNITFTQM